MPKGFKKRLKSFAWRLGMMILAVVIEYLIQDFTSYNLGATGTVVAGLILGEISKFLNTEIGGTLKRSE